MFSATVLTLAVAALPALTLAAPLQSRALPEPISASAARAALAGLTVKAEANSGTYNRDLFPHWIESGECSTRETVLKRDGSGVSVGSDCYPTSGSWYSPYDGATWTAASDVDIDHLVPLSEAWKSGASEWTTSQRQAFANDLTRPQLLAVTDNVNQDKSDADPANWLPPLSSYHCTYSRAWVQVKDYYDLAVDSAEKSALENILNGC